MRVVQCAQSERESEKGSEKDKSIVDKLKS